MKHFINLLFLFVGAALNAQEKTYPVPDYDNAPVYYDVMKNAMTELDAVQFTMGGRPKGLTGAEAALYLDGTTSTVKVHPDSTIFLVNLKAGIDPRTLMDLNKAVVNTHSGKREFVIYKKGMYSSETTNITIDLNFKKLGDGHYLVTPKIPITAGEYFFSLLDNTKSHIVYCFTIK